MTYRPKPKSILKKAPLTKFLSDNTTDSSIKPRAVPLVDIKKAEEILLLFNDAKEKSSHKKQKVMEELTLFTNPLEDLNCDTSRISRPFSVDIATIVPNSNSERSREREISFDISREDYKTTNNAPIQFTFKDDTFSNNDLNQSSPVKHKRLGNYLNTN